MAGSDSAPAPGFNSNGATFSVSTAATDAVKFFRLSQSSDLRGIYINTPLGGGPNNPSSAPVTNAMQLPGADTDDNDNLLLLISRLATEEQRSAPDVRKNREL